MLDWLFGRKEAPAGGTAAPAPGPLAAAPAGVSVHASGAVAGLGHAAGRPGATRLGTADGESGDGALAWAAVVLSGEAAGDVVFASGSRLDVPVGAALLLDAVPAEGAPPVSRIPRETLAGSIVTGVTGARVLARTDARAVLRFGPPPAARWAVDGLRSVAVFRGKLTLIDGEEATDVRAGEVAFVADPSATLRVLAGNDAAVAVAFASAGVAIRLE